MQIKAITLTGGIVQREVSITAELTRRGQTLTIVGTQDRNVAFEETIEIHANADDDNTIGALFFFAEETFTFLEGHDGTNSDTHEIYRIMEQVAGL